MGFEDRDRVKWFDQNGNSRRSDGCRTAIRGIAACTENSSNDS
jgi:hypothetical protein